MTYIASRRRGWSDAVLSSRICNDCPVRRECLDYALENDERHGIWGGLSERERRALIRARREAAA